MSGAAERSSAVSRLMDGDKWKVTESLSPEEVD